MQNKKNRENYSRRLRIKDMDQYINSGVLLVNTKKIREDNLEKKFYEYIPYLKKIGSNFPDQDVINAVCYNKIKFLSPIYNYSTSLHRYKGVMPKEFLENFNAKDKEKQIIIHYAGGDKPWKTNKVPFFKDWEKYTKIYENRIRSLS